MIERFVECDDDGFFIIVYVFIIFECVCEC